MLALVLACLLPSAAQAWQGGQRGQMRQVGQAAAPLIDEIEVLGNRRVPAETVLYHLQSKRGDPYDPGRARRDFEAVLALGFFDPLRSRLWHGPGPRGGLTLTFRLSEYPVIRDLRYEGLKSATESEVLARFKERGVQLGKETQFDPARAVAARGALAELLAEKGRPDARIEVEAEEISATAVALVFRVAEGPRVRVKTIEFVGTADRVTPGQLRAAMRLVKEAGLLSSLTGKDIYSRARLEDDLERLRHFLGTQGYLQARIGEPRVARAGDAAGGLPLPLLRRKGPGLSIAIPLETGRRYRIAGVVERGVTLFPAGRLTEVTGLKAGEIASAETIRRGVYENVRNLYGSRGYIQASVDLQPKFTDLTAEEGDVEFTLEVEEGKQFTLRRLEFIGNTTTRDTVLRREVLLNEGDPYSKQLWDLSLLRLNQLGLFEPIAERDAITRTDDRGQTVDVDLQVRERARQQVNFSGGISGVGGSFVTLSYATNNLLGYGESLNFDLTAGNREQSLAVGFTEPYLLGRPVSLGVQLFAERRLYFGPTANAADGAAAAFALDRLFTQQRAGGAVRLSAPLSYLAPRWQKYGHFARVGLSYSLTTTGLSDPPVNRDGDPANDVTRLGGEPRILTSRLQPTLSFSTLDSGFDPTRGQSLQLGLGLAGGLLGGDVKTVSPALEYKFFTRVLRRQSARPHVLGVRFSAGHVRAFGAPLTTGSFSYVGGVPIYERFFLGGEDSIRGYNVRSISPLVARDDFLSTRGATPMVRDAAGGLAAAPAGTAAPSVARAYTFDAPAGACGETPSADCNVVRSRSYHAVGGDTQLLGNVEYRIPLFGPVTVAAFADVGTVFNARGYRDAVVTSNYVGGDLTRLGSFVGGTVTPGGVVLNPAGRIATPDELAGVALTGSAGGLPPGYRLVEVRGEARTYDIVRLSQSQVNFLSTVRSSVGAELRIQVPVINLPLRLIFAYNPQAQRDQFGRQLERRTVFSFGFGFGRTF